MREVNSRDQVTGIKERWATHAVCLMMINGQHYLTLWLFCGWLMSPHPTGLLFHSWLGSPDLSWLCAVEYSVDNLKFTRNGSNRKKLLFDIVDLPLQATDDWSPVLFTHRHIAVRDPHSAVSVTLTFGLVVNFWVMASVDNIRIYRRTGSPCLDPGAGTVVVRRRRRR